MQASIVDQYLLVDYVCCVPSPLIVRLLTWEVNLEPIRAATPGQGQVAIRAANTAVGHCGCTPVQYSAFSISRAPFLPRQ